MPIYAKSTGSKTYAAASPGTHSAVCVDVIDLGMQEDTKYNPGKLRHRIRIVWQIDEDREDGKPFEVSKWYTLSLHEKSNLRPDLESWRGRVFTEEELEQFDVETVLGAPAFLNLIHKTEDGKTYANVTSIMKLPKGMKGPTIRDYVRVCDRKTEFEPVSTNGGGDHFEITDDDVPF